MGRTIFKDEAGVDDRVACLRALIDCLEECLSHCSYVLRGNVGAHHFAHELAPGLYSFGVNRLDIANYSGVLACAT